MRGGCAEEQGAREETAAGILQVWRHLVEENRSNAGAGRTNSQQEHIEYFWKVSFE